MGVLVFYAAAGVPLVSLWGPGVLALSAIVVVVAAWLLGLWGGLAAAALTVPVHTVVLNASSGVGWDWNVVVSEGGGPRTLTVLLLGGAIGVARELHRQRNQARAIVESASDAVVGVDGDQRVVFANEQAESVFGYPSGGLVGVPLRALIPSRYRETHARHAAGYLAGERAPPGAFTACGLRRSGEEFPCETTLMRLRGGKGPVAVAFVRDVSDREAAKAKLEEAEERFRRAFESAPTGIAMVGLDHRFIKVNPALCSMVGYPEETLVTRSWATIVHPDDRSHLRTPLAELVETSLELRHIRADRRVLWIKVNVAPVVDRRGQALYLLAQFADITDLKVAHRQLEGLLQSKDELIASVSHELRTPLTAVVGFTHELRDRWWSLDPKEQAELISLVADQADELSAIVDDLITAARLKEGSITLQPRAVRIDEELSLVAAQRSWNGSGDSRIAFEDCAATVWADPLRLRQILRNLIANAHRYGGDRIEIQASPDGTVGRIRVTDNGEGVPPDQEPAIFEPYFSAHPPQGRQAHAMGLGLTVSRNLALAMGGDLTYHRQNGNTVFELTLPAHQPSAGRKAGLHSTPGNRRGPPRVRRS